MRVSTFTCGSYLEFPIEFLNEAEEYISSKNMEFPFNLVANEREQSVQIQGKQDVRLTNEYNGHKTYIEAIMLEEVFQIIHKRIKEHLHENPFPFKNRMSINGCYFINRDHGFEGAYIITQLFPMMVTPYVKSMCLENEFITDIIKSKAS